MRSISSVIEHVVEDKKHIFEILGYDPPVLIYCLYSESFPAEYSCPIQKYTKLHNDSGNYVLWECVLEMGYVGLHLM